MNQVLRLNLVTLAVNSTNCDPQEKEGRILSLTFFNHNKEPCISSISQVLGDSWEWLWPRETSATACYRVTDWLKGTQNIEYVSSEIRSFSKIFSKRSGVRNGSPWQGPRTDAKVKMSKFLDRGECVFPWQKYASVQITDRK